MRALALAALLSACGGRPARRDEPVPSDGGPRDGGDADSDSDADSDTDADSDSDSDADSDTWIPSDGGPSGCLQSEVICDGACSDLATDEANCGGCGRACGEGTTCERGLCRCEDSWYGHGVLYCAPGEDCVDGDCTCLHGRVDCGDSCSDLSTDESNCGQCDGFCAGECISGVCRCQGDQVECERPAWDGGGATCTDLASDPLHCGTCGNACGAGEYCVAGECTCRPERAQCDGGWGGSACVDVSIDPANCGECGHACADPTPVCWEGVCVAECPRAADECGAFGALAASCYDFDGSEDACGGCGGVCAGDELCVDEGCTAWVPAIGCTECPCASCGTWGVCCGYPGAAETAICVSGDRCPE